MHRVWPHCGTDLPRECPNSLSFCLLLPFLRCFETDGLDGHTVADLRIKNLVNSLGPTLKKLQPRAIVVGVKSHLLAQVEDQSIQDAGLDIVFADS